MRTARSNNRYSRSRAICRIADFAYAVAAVLALVGTAADEARAESATVAVAANFLAPAGALTAAFESASGHDVSLVSGSTGQLYAQIVNGAPFDVLLAADRERPALLARSGDGDPASIFTYALGRLALWSARPGFVDEALLYGLDEADFRWLAIANPALAPYGDAARSALTALGVWERVKSRIAQGQNIGQTFALAQSGSADLALVALSQAIQYRGAASFIAVPQSLHGPIRQDAVLLNRAAGNPAAKAFMVFLQSPAARAEIERFGYVVTEAVD